MANARTPGQANLAKAPSPGLTGRANALELPGVWGGGQGAAANDWCIMPANINSVVLLNVAS